MTYGLGMANPPSETPSLDELRALSAAEVDERELEPVHVPHAFIPSIPPKITFRVKLYWALRRLIDWIHP
jgi:hypothetical protein